MNIFSKFQSGLIVVSLLFLAACSSAPPNVGVQPVKPPSPSRTGTESYAVCQANLSEVGWDFEPVASFTTPEGCGVTEAVKLERSMLNLTRPVVVTCDLAYTIARFEFEILQPLAEEYFGQEVAKIEHVGSYNCRGMRSRASRLSEHAKGRAIDITGFVLKDGTRIRVLQDWRGQGRKSEFLQKVGKASCRLFSVVLTPNADKDHQDHYHLDVGPQRHCGA